jgi:phage tail sheath protein FI
MNRSQKQPRIYVENIQLQPQPIEGISTSTSAFLGETQIGPTMSTLVTSWLEFQKLFGGYFGEGKFLPYAVEGFFLNGGQRCFVKKVVNNDYSAALAELEKLDDVSIVYSPNAQAVPGLADLLIEHCERLRSRFVIFDSLKGQNASSVSKPRASSFAALYYPWIQVKEAGTNRLCLVPPGGHVAGIYARTDIEKGVHKAPANALVKGAVDLEFQVNQRQQDILNPQGINCIRALAGKGIRVWGARTLSSDPIKKYVNVQRLLIYLEQSIKKGTAWTTFEFNNEATWAKVKVATEGFLEPAWLAGMLLGAKSHEAYFVKCDRSTMTQNDIVNGRLIMLIGVAPIKPAEFLILRIAHATTRT